MKYSHQINDSLAYIKHHVSSKPTIGLVLGSGLGDLSQHVQQHIEIPYKDIPHFPVSTVAGHTGSLLFGTYQGHEVVFMQGRFHYYEGYTMKEVVFPYYVLKALGVKTMILTNACGGINLSYQPGDIVVVEDFINLVLQNPLIGENDPELGPRFPDMTQPYDENLRLHAQHCAETLNIPFKTGVYGFFAGPYYETRAEIRAYGQMGCDLIGMSTVPETIALNHMGVRTIVFAVVTNMATGIQNKKHDHAHVVDMAKQAAVTLSQWLELFIQTLPNQN
ncbi:MAG: purine-nucleoside phosphorylase [Erysipelotrichia bacterium]|jgi:purine-nucleoside phosphorylase|nr:purine-nucleoside phosphorylase [Erysipelotrichia bacterium]